MIVIETDQFVRKPIEREAHFMKAVGQFFEDIVQFAAARGRVPSHELEIGPTDFLVEVQVGRTAPTKVLGVFMKNSAHEKRVVSNMRTEEKTLRGRGAG